jgi:hypothetical protein
VFRRGFERREQRVEEDAVVDRGAGGAAVDYDALDGVGEATAQ